MIAMPEYTPPSGGGISDVVDDTSPQLGGNLDTNAHFIDIDDAKGLRDSAGNEYLIFQETANATNYVEITNAASGFQPKIAANGAGNVALQLSGSGSGVVSSLSAFECSSTLTVYGTSQLTKAKITDYNTVATHAPSAFFQGGTYLYVTAGAGVQLPNSPTKGTQFVILNDSGAQISLTAAGGEAFVGSQTVDNGKAVTCVAVTTSKWFVIG